MGERAFTKLQWGLEGTKGTAVAADTFLLAAPLSINTDRRPTYPADVTGTRARNLRSYISEYLVRNTITMDADHPAYFQILPMLFSIGLKGGVTATESTTGQGDYAWDFTPSLTAANSPQSITLEAGDDVQAFECEYTQIERYQIAGSINQDGDASPVTINADFFGRQWSTTTFTGSIALPTTEIMNAKQTLFYLDTAWASVGNTAKAGLLRDYSIEIMTGLHPKFHGDATKVFSASHEGFIEFMATFTFEGTSDADAIYDAWAAQSLAVARLKIQGSQIGSGANHSLTIDLGGTWEAVVPLGGEDRGNNLHTAVLHGKYDITGAKLLQVNVVTNVSAI